MESTKASKGEKKSKNSIWFRLTGQSRKSNLKEKDPSPDITLTRSEKLYSSFRKTPSRSASRASSDITGGSTNDHDLYRTLDGSAIAQVHKDAGILFLNDGVLQLGSNKEEARHVQFAPTPLNKYYDRDPPPVTNSAAEKENLHPTRNSRACRSILRNRDSDDFSQRRSRMGGDSPKDEDEQSKLLKVKCMMLEIQSKQTPSFPRTSTRVALKDHQNLPLPDLDESAIVSDNTAAPKCKGLPRYLPVPPHKAIRPTSVGFNDPVAYSLTSNKTKESFGSAPFLPKQNGGVQLPPYLPTRAAMHQAQLRPKGVVSQSETGHSIPNQRRYSLGPFVTQQNHQLEDFERRRQICEPRPSAKGAMRPAVNHSAAIQKRAPAIPEHPQQGQIIPRNVQTTSNNQRQCPAVRRQAFPSNPQVADSEASSSRNHRYSVEDKRNVQEGSPTNRRAPDHANKLKHGCIEMQTLGLPNCTPNVAFPKKFPHHGSNSSTKSGSSNTIPASSNYAKHFERQMPSDGRPVHPQSSSNQHQKANAENKFVEHHAHLSNSGANGPGDACSRNTPKIAVCRSKVLTSSPSIPGGKTLPKSWKYDRWLKEREDCASSMADDEFSMNCSCTRCTHRFIREAERDVSRILEEEPVSHCSTEGLKANRKGPIGRKSVRSRNQSGDSVKTQSTALSPHIYEALVKKDPCATPRIEVMKTPTEWYECEDTPCKRSAKGRTFGKCPDETNLVSKSSESIYTNEGISKIIERAVRQTLEQLISMNTVPMLKTPNRTRSLENVPNNSSNVGASPLYMNLDAFRSKVEESRDQKSDSTQNALSPVKCSLSLPPGLKIDLSPSHVQMLQQTFQKLLVDCGAFVKVQQPLSQDKFESKDGDQASKPEVGQQQDAQTEIVVGKLPDTVSRLDAQETRSPINKEILEHSQSLPDLVGSKMDGSKLSRSAISLVHCCGNPSEERERVALPDIMLDDPGRKSSVIPTSSETTLSSRHSPDGWEKTPTSDNSSAYSTVTGSSCDSISKEALEGSSSRDLSVSTEKGMAMLEEVMRIGMGLAPTQKSQRSPLRHRTPTKKTKFKAKDVLSGKAKLKLSIYYNAGLVTIHIMRAAKLTSSRAKLPNPYVKVSLVPDNMKRAHWRTTVVKAQKSPIFDQKFSFEILPEDSNKRLVFSVWHRDSINQRSELLGCMSFGLHHVMDDTQCINGWYRLLREAVGTQKHFAAHPKKNKFFMQNPGNGFLGIVSKACVV